MFYRMSLKKIIDVGSVNSLLKQGVINKEGVRLIDCSYALSARSDWNKFRKEEYAKFEQLLAAPSPLVSIFLSFFKYVTPQISQTLPIRSHPRSDSHRSRHCHLALKIPEIQAISSQSL